jgi:hypothetical protein
VEDDGDLGLLGELEVLDEEGDVVAVDGAEVAQAVLLEEG